MIIRLCEVDHVNASPQQVAALTTCEGKAISLATDCWNPDILSVPDHQFRSIVNLIQFVISLQPARPTGNEHELSHTSLQDVFIVPNLSCPNLKEKRICMIADFGDRLLRNQLDGQLVAVQKITLITNMIGQPLIKPKSPTGIILNFDDAIDLLTVCLLE
jgi:hypothetical protein